MNDCLRPIMCTAPVSYRTSGICGGGEFIVLTDHSVDKRLTAEEILKAKVEKVTDEYEEYFMFYEPSAIEAMEAFASQKVEDNNEKWREKIKKEVSVLNVCLKNPDNLTMDKKWYEWVIMQFENLLK
jgi:hypothetical protein